jgi:hypothetical protein
MSHATTAQALVLDFGGVISRMLFETHPLTEQALGLAPGTLTRRGPGHGAQGAGQGPGLCVRGLAQPGAQGQQGCAGAGGGHQRAAGKFVV